MVQEERGSEYRGEVGPQYVQGQPFSLGVGRRAPHWDGEKVSGFSSEQSRNLIHQLRRPRPGSEGRSKDIEGRGGLDCQTESSGKESWITWLQRGVPAVCL